MQKAEVEIFYPRNASEWREWLAQNHNSKQAVWVVFYTKASGKKSLSWPEAVEEALCFGWIDSKKVKIDEITAHQYFSRRKPKSVWSKINKDKVQELIETGRMTPAGMHCIEVAKQNGYWTLLDEAEELIIPKDLETALAKHQDASDYFTGLSKSVKKAILQWLVMARKPETRQKRINEIVASASRKQRPKQFQ